jgi:K+-transporting ATPase ATPase C chain
MKKNLIISLRFTLLTTILLGILYPLVVTGLSQVFFPERASGQLIKKNGKVVGSRIIGQTFTDPTYFHSRPSYAGTGYDAAQSAGSTLAPTNHALLERVKRDVNKLHTENPAAAIPIDLVTASGSGLDPEISPAAAEFQILRVASARQMSEADVRILVSKYTLPRQFGFLGEPRVRVLELNLALDAQRPNR